MTAKVKPRIVVLGGGFGGLEVALYLRMRLPDQAEIVLVSADDHFLFKPNTIYIPFGLDPNTLKFSLIRPTKHKDIKFVHASAQHIDPISKHVHVNSYEHGYQLSYDYLVVATGAGMRPDAVPGLGELAHTISTPEGMLALRAGFHELVDQLKRGGLQDVLFLVPPNNKHSGPLYEMALMLDTWLRRKKVRSGVNITFATCEESYVQAFGPKMHEVISEEFERRKIGGLNGYSVDAVEATETVFRNGERLPFGLLVTFPPYAASTRFESLPSDPHGFILTDTNTTQVVGYPEVYALGDAARFPAKQAHIAVQQADATAEHLSARILGAAPRFDFQPEAMYVLEGLDRATFVQAPMQVMDTSEGPLGVSEDSQDRYKVGTSSMWKLSKMAIGIYLPWRFKAGNPLHAGAPWKGLEAGMKVMSSLTAR